MEENNREYTNGEITVYWRPKECIHATTCFRELRPVFSPSRRPWVDMSQASTEEIIRVVDLCPTDALTYTWNNKSKSEIEKNIQDKKEEMGSEVEKLKSGEAGAPPVEVRVMKDGPLVVKGEFKTIGADGKELKKMKISSFCRCGQSLKMPHCDGTHRKIGWASS